MEARHWLAPLGPGVSASCAYLLRRLLEPRPAARVRMAQLLQVRAAAGAGSRAWLAPP
jgi:hypothetical protein